jgi:hypothetical protein
LNALLVWFFSTGVGSFSANTVLAPKSNELANKVANNISITGIPLLTNENAQTLLGILNQFTVD